MQVVRVISVDISNHSLLPQLTNMTSLATSSQTISSSDWMQDVELGGVYGKDLVFQDVDEDISNDNFDYEPIRVSILDIPSQSVWSTDCLSLSQRDSPFEFASKFKQTWDTITCSPLENILPPYKGVFFHGMTRNESFFKKPPVSTAEVGVQTMTTSIHRFPVPCRSHPVPWGLDTDEPSPLTVHSITIDHSYNGNKRKLEDSTTWKDSTWPPKKRQALDDQDYEFLNNLFGDFLKSTSDKDEYSEDNATINEEGVTESPIPCENDDVVKVDNINLSSRTVSTNTMHVPMRKGPSQCKRSKAWAHAAKQFLSVEDQQDKRGPRQGTQNDKTNRMINKINAYYCYYK